MNQSLNNQNIFKISIIVPVLNESENIAPLALEISKAINNYSYEIIFVDDGSTDKTKEEIFKIAKNVSNLRLIVHKERQGQSAAMRSGVLSAKYSVIGTIDGDLQNDPLDFNNLINSYKSKSNKHILITGFRVKRKDSFHKIIASLLARIIRKLILRDTHPDSGCGIRVFDKKLFIKMPFFNHMHRFFPTLALREGAKVESIPVNHRQRQKGTSKYTNFGRAFAGIYDIIGVIWLLRRSSKNISQKEYNLYSRNKND